MDIDFVGLLSRVLHTTCAATLLGGTVYLRFVLAPAAGDDAESTCFAGRRRAWSSCVGVCTGLLLLSGLYNFITITAANEKFPPLYHAAFGTKFLLAFVVFAISALLAGKTKLAEKMRTRMTRWLNVTLFATLAIFVLAALMKLAPHIPKPEFDSEAPTFQSEETGDMGQGVPTLPEFE